MVVDSRRRRVRGFRALCSHYDCDVRLLAPAVGVVGTHCKAVAIASKDVNRLGVGSAKLVVTIATD